MLRTGTRSGAITTDRVRANAASWRSGNGASIWCAAVVKPTAASPADQHNENHSTGWRSLDRSDCSAPRAASSADQPLATRSWAISAGVEPWLRRVVIHVAVAFVCSAVCMVWHLPGGLVRSASGSTVGGRGRVWNPDHPSSGGGGPPPASVTAVRPAWSSGGPELPWSSAMSSDEPQLQAVVFDTDGVITHTAAVHFAAWKDVFDPFLAAPRPARSPTVRRCGLPAVRRRRGPLRRRRRRWCDRGIEIDFGDPDDPPGTSTVCAIGNLKNGAFEEAVSRYGVAPYSTTRRFIEELHDPGVRTAVISASKNCRMVLAAAGMDDMFEVRVDGNDAAALGFPGKPAPDVFLQAAARLGVDPPGPPSSRMRSRGCRPAGPAGSAWSSGWTAPATPTPLDEFADLVVPDCADLEVVERACAVSYRPAPT